MPLTIVDLRGGFGNQLLQIIFGLKLTGADGRPVFNKLDETPRSSVDVAAIFPEFRYISARRVPKRLKKVPWLEARIVVDESACGAFEVKTGPLRWYRGHFQDLTFRAELNAQILQKLDVGLDRFLAATYPERTTPLECVLHVRGGDYLAPEYVQRYHHLSGRYYQDAVARLRESRDIDRLSVVTDDPDYARQVLADIDGHIEFLEPATDIADFATIRNADCAVVANSTFSVMARQLARPGSLTVGPKNWYQPGAGIRDPDILGGLLLV